MIVTLSTEDAHGEFEIDQVSTVVPTVKPVSVDDAERELVIVPGPETFTHTPTPAVGVLPAKVVEPVLTQTVWSTPAFAIDGNALPTIVTLSFELAQGGFEVVQRKTLFPTPKPVIVVAGFVGVVIVPDPLIKVHNPEPAVGVLAAIVAAELTHTVWSGPAAAIEGGEFTVIVTFEVEGEQGGLLIDHVNTVMPGLILVNPEFLKLGFASVPDPETMTQRPVPAVGALPAKKVEAVPVVAHNV